MKKYYFLLIAAALTLDVQSQIPDAQIQIKTAVLAAPEEQRDGATVLGYGKNGELTELRKGTNEMICLADDPVQKGFHVACYHRDLDPFMARGRQLNKEGKSGTEVFEMRESEVKAGKLSMPEAPSTLFVLTAPDESYNAQSGEVSNTYLRYVIYIPYATAESTGLPLKPGAPGMPWIMDPGTHRAHIMINPPAD
jgi:hypothetical protein